MVIQRQTDASSKGILFHSNSNIIEDRRTVSFCSVKIPYCECGVTEIKFLFILCSSWSVDGNSLLSDLWQTMLL